MQNDSQVKDKGKSANLLVQQGLVVAAVPLIGYAMAFVYEVGFCSEFRIPREFISINLTTVFIAVGALLGVIAAIYFLVNMFLIVVPKPKNRVLRRELSAFYAVSLIILVIVIIFWGLWLELISVAVLFLFFVFFIFVFPLITQRKGSYLEKLEAQRRVDSQFKTIEDYLISFLGIRNIIMLMLVVLVVMFSYIAGIAQAKKQTEFMVPSTYPNSVVLRVYGDNMICAPFNRTDNTTQKRFFIIEMGDSSTPLLNVEKVGPLQLAAK